MARGQLWTDADKAIARAGWAQGLTHHEIAAQLSGRTPTSVRHILASMGCIWSGDERDARRDVGRERYRAQQAAQKLHQDAKVRRRFTRIDQTGNCQPRPDQERMAAVLSDIAFREAYTAAALRNGWIVRQIAA